MSEALLLASYVYKRITSKKTHDRLTNYGKEENQIWII